MAPATNVAILTGHDWDEDQTVRLSYDNGTLRV